MTRSTFILLLLCATSLLTAQETHEKSKRFHRQVYANREKIAFFIEETIDSMQQGKTFDLDGQQIHSPRMLPTFYENRDFAPAWKDFAALEDA